MGHFKDLQSLASVEAAGGNGYIAATFDNVSVNDTAVTPPHLAALPPSQRSWRRDERGGWPVRQRDRYHQSCEPSHRGDGQQAFLYWATIGKDGTFTAPTLNGVTVNGALIGQSDDIFWGAFQNYA